MATRFENMPPSAQKAYKTTNNIRKVALFVSAALGVLYIILMAMTLKTDFGGVLVVFCAGLAFVQGNIHCEFVYKGCFKKLFIFGFFPAGIVFMFASLLGWIFWIIDLILFILKKPLIYPFENKYFMTDEALREIGEQRAKMYTETPMAMNNLQHLKELLDQGAITEEEYNQKKEELLKKI